MADLYFSNSDFAAEFDKLRRDYRRRLSQELHEIERLAMFVSVDKAASRPYIVQLSQRLHKLAGSGGSFGFEQLSIRSRKLVQTQENWLSSPQERLDEQAVSQFFRDVAALKSAIGQQDPQQLDIASSAGKNYRPESAFRIWLIEDDDSLANELAHALRQFGYDVRRFERRTEAVRAASDDGPMLVVDGNFCLSEQAGDADHPGVAPRPHDFDCPKLFISSRGDFDSRIRAARLGAEGLFIKPVNVQRLVDRVEQLAAEQQARPYRILIVDDDVALTEHFRLVLVTEGMEVAVLNEPGKIIDEINLFRPELVLLDLQMPGYSGTELASVVRQFDEWTALPIVFLSAVTDLDKQIHALGHGADDFLTKPITDSQLAAAVKTRAKRSRQLAELMSKDSLTGLLKHAGIKEDVHLELARSQRSEIPLSLVMLDIDHFKAVNDTYGHTVGDQVIRALAQLLRQRCRESDRVGRYGGEEFAMLLPHCSSEDAFVLVDDLRQRFATLHFRHGLQEFNCSFSAGIACSNDYPDRDSEFLFDRADQALYAAKHGGRNRVVIATRQN